MKINRRSRLEYQKRIDKALQFVRENLHRPLSLKEVATAACFSPFHFHRIFSALMNEPMGKYITRKRLEWAAIKLAYAPSTSVTDVAFDYGYASVAGFSKAFNQWFGCRPTEIAKIKQRLATGIFSDNTIPESTINEKQLYKFLVEEDQTPGFERINRRVSIRSIESFNLVYLTSPYGYDFKSITNTWQTLVELAEDQGVSPADVERFSLSHDHPGLTDTFRCRYDAGLKLREENAYDLGLPKVAIPSGRYAIYPVEGPKECILDQYLEFYTLWMPESGYEPDDFPVLERYLPGCRDDHIAVELWAKIKRLSSL